ncbi:MAG TPA: hypothetical protein VGM98_04745 [Schlesneria sp.]|jgi:hypothetical protein
MVHSLFNVLPASQVGQMATCQKCKYAFVASNPDIAIPPEFDDSIPVAKRGPTPAPVPIEKPVISRETELRLEGKRLASEISATKRVAAGPTEFQGWLVITLLIIVAAAGFIPKPQGTTKWEYRIESPSDFETTSSFNSYGQDGWEIVSARRAIDSITNKANYEIIMKRPIR